METFWGDYFEMCVSCMFYVDKVFDKEYVMLSNIYDKK